MSDETTSDRIVLKHVNSKVTLPDNLGQLEDNLLEAASVSGGPVCSSENRKLQLFQPSGWPPETGVLLPAQHILQETTNGDGRMAHK